MTLLLLRFRRVPVNLLFRLPARSRSLLPFSTTATSAASAAATFPIPFSPLVSHLNPGSPQPSPISREIAAAFGEWFRSGSEPLSLLDRIYAALASSPDDASLDASLARLRIPLCESLVLRILRHCPHPSIIPADAAGNGGVNGLLLLRLRFFDWSGRRPPYRHSRAAFHAVFRLLSRARLVSVVLDWLSLFSSSSLDRRHHSFLPHATFSAAAPLGPHPRFHDTLVIGYAVAGKPEFALQLLARMRFQGLDLDAFSYHVLINSLIEASVFDFADSLLSQLSARGLDGPVTACIRIKSLCRQGRLDDAETYLRDLAATPTPSYREVPGRMVGTLAHAFCQEGKFEAAGRIVDEFGSAEAYSVWLGNLVGAGRLNAAMEFMQSKKVYKDYIPESFHYSKLVFRLLKKNRLGDVYNVLVEMIEEGISPDRFIMNAALCFFCKAGLVDVAVMLYNSRKELGIYPSLQVYDHLIIALCRGGKVDEVCPVLEESMQQGYFPGKQTFTVLSDLLCREGRLDKMRKLLDGALLREVKPLSIVFSRYISALCKAGEAEEACLVPHIVGRDDAGLLGRYKSTYINLIRAFIILRRLDVLPQLIIEMQDQGHIPAQSLYRSVVCCLCEMNQFDTVFDLLNRQLNRKELDQAICYNFFIYGAAHAKKPEIAKVVYNMMLNAGVQPTIDTSFVLLQSYLKSKLIGDAYSFFNYLREQREPSTKLYNIFITGLCEARLPEQAVTFWKEMREKGLIPSLQCYEELVLRLSSAKCYDLVVKVIQDFRETGRPASSFLGNVLLLHSLKSQELLQAWIQSRETDRSRQVSGETQGFTVAKLGDLIVAFSRLIRWTDNSYQLEELVERFFPADIYTYNMLLRVLSKAGRMDYACDLFHRISKKGFEPNRWTFDIIVHGFCKHGRRTEAERWMEAMYRHGFAPTSYTKQVYYNTF